MTALSLVKSEATESAAVKPTPKKAKSLLSPKDAAKLHAKSREDDSWCVDVSSNFPILLHALSDRTASAQDLKLDFPRFAYEEDFTVVCDSYPAFLSGLADRVMSLLPRVYGKGMRPCADRFIVDDAGIQLANIYNPAILPAPSPIPAPYDSMVDLFGQQVPEILAEMLARLFPDVGERRYVVQRFAAIIKTPMRKVKHAMFIVGAGGTGKSSLLDIMEVVLCRRHIDRTPTYKGLLEPFSEVACNNRVVGIEDKAIGRGGEAYTYTNMKQLIDYDKRTVQIKHQQRSVQREMYSHFIITTNNPNLFPWDGNERRFYAPRYVNHLISEEESGEFFQKFHDFLALPEAAALLYDWLNNVDMTGFDYGRCPRTTYMQELISQAGSMLSNVIDDYIDGIDIFHPKAFTAHLSAAKQQIKTDDIKDELMKRGWEYERMKFVAEGFDDARFRVWRKAPPVGRNFRTLTSEEKHALMMAEGAAY
jgi:hypothetical protein